jgi:hypothetical protein
VKRAIALVVLAALAGAALIWLRGGSDADQIRAQLARLGTALSVPEGANPVLRGARMQSELDAVFEEDVRTNIAELPTTLPNKRSELASAAAQLSLTLRWVEVGFTDIEIKLDDAKQTARVGATVKLAASGRDGPRRDTRAADFLFNKRDGTWRIASVTVWSKDDALPP